MSTVRATSTTTTRTTRVRRFQTGFVSAERASAQQVSGQVHERHREPSSTPVYGQTTGTVMEDAGFRPSFCYAVPPFKERVIGFEPLYVSARKCFKGVGRKYSAQSYVLNVIENTVRLSGKLRRGTYRPGNTHVVHITYPKKRTALAISFRDRVYQRSLNDNSLYGQMVRSFIHANCACQRGKGTHVALNLLRAMIRRAYVKYGTCDFYVLSCDIRHYYDSMPHELTNCMFSRHVDRWTADRVIETLDGQYAGSSGYNPGSQMVQIAGMSYLNPIDHFIKERLRVKLYVRYMDDFHIIARDPGVLEEYRNLIGHELGKLGLVLHPTKTKIRKIRDGVTFLGYTFSVSPTGKVLILRDRRRIKEIRRRMRRLCAKIVRGEAPIDALITSYGCVRSAASYGTSRNLMQRLDSFYLKLQAKIDAVSRIPLKT